MNVPTTVPIMVPRPPNRLAPPMTTAAIALSSSFWPATGVATAKFAITIIPANPASNPELLAELGKLPRRQRAVLVLRYYEGLSDTEIAEALGCTPGTVRGYVSRALAALRVQIGQQAPGFVQEGYRR